ncbi:D-amino acid dehydrogenase [Comamonas sp. Y33R10-2]|uniref:D-amino acid dehydrogenase n=1 Tax=Comamonas sp. Y33R10-2 TaxID=2853257 RepID=UPI001C5C9255|nr:D-amino acid dehydrogenase [Comamonas sp. Y33R10-2]QXZ08770.1 D-amino acid dehydrogenase [Comamonas sp. Y33R10-2]
MVLLIFCNCADTGRMNIIVLGAGIIGISTAWHLRERGHQVTVVDRQSGPALETSYANGGQISVSYCEPWANRQAPWKALKWMFDKEAPLLFRPQLDPAQWRWCLQFLAQCNDKAFARNVQQIVALGAYSHVALKDMVKKTGITFERLERGIAHFYSSQKAFDEAAEGVQLMRQYGVQRRLVSRDELLKIEPAFTPYAAQIAGGTFTQTDESGDARVFTEKLADLCDQSGVEFLYGQQILSLQAGCKNAPARIKIQANEGGAVRTLSADAVVVACGSYTPLLLKPLGVNVPIYPGKGYSATLALLQPEKAPIVSTIDDSRKVAMTRLGNHLRVAGTIELGGFDMRLETPTARARCEMLVRRVEELMPGVCDTRLPEEGGEPQFWCGLRPATPTNIPCIGATQAQGIWVNAGHGTLGWTHGAGSGKAMAALMSGEQPALDFGFWGEKLHSPAPAQMATTA